MPVRPAAVAALILATPALAEPAVEAPRLYLAYGAASSGAAYMVIRNPGGPDDRLLAAASPAARTVALHGSEEQDGVVRMTERPEGVELPAEGLIELAPGGLHVMLMGLEGPLAPGEAVPLTLQFESGPVELALPVEVQGAGGEGSQAPGNHAHGDHGDHGG